MEPCAGKAGALGKHLRISIHSFNASKRSASRMPRLHLEINLPSQHSFYEEPSLVLGSLAVHVSVKSATTSGSFRPSLFREDS